MSAFEDRARFPRRSLAAVVALAATLVLTACSTLPPEEEGVSAEASEVLGRVQKVRATEDDTLVDLAREHSLGYVEIVAANPGVDPWLPGDREILLPTAFVLPPHPRRGIVVNLAEQRLFLFPDGQAPQSFPIGVSRDGWKTPLGETRVVRKKEGPTWYPGPTARVDYEHLGPVVPPGPDNPLGTHAIYLGWQAILIHGTNEPYGIGRRVSRGCIRLYPEDIVRLYPLVEKGMEVRVINEPILLGWSRGELYLEVHPTLAQADELEEKGEFTPVEVSDEVRERILAAVGDEAGRLNWDRIDWALRERAGIPVRITDREMAPGGGLWSELRRWLRAFTTPGGDPPGEAPEPAVAGEPGTARPG